jgi:AbrB family looped-hinge helix DNA binding protein
MNWAVKAKVSEGGRITIPADMRRDLGICEGDNVLMQVVDGELRVYTLEHAIQSAQAVARRYVPEGVSLADELIADRRAEAERE